MKTCLIDSPLGKLRAAANDEGLAGLWFEGQKYYPPNIGNWIESPEEEIFKSLRAWMEVYFAGKKSFPSLALSPAGTGFQKTIWRYLLEIPYGTTSTYGKLAAALAAEQGRPSMSAQAVGGAVGHNPITIIIPCHRVLGSAGDLTGYAGGLDRKLALLKLEGVMLI